MNKHWQSAVAVIARWRRNRPKAVADAISGSASYELIEAVSGAIEMAAGAEAAPHAEAAGELETKVQELAETNAILTTELEALRRQHGLLQGDLAPGATAQDARPNCETCGDAGFEEFADGIIPCRSCVGKA